MASIVIAGDTSGSVTLAAPATAGTTTLTLPATSGTVLTTTGGVAPGTAGNVLTSNGTTWTSATPAAPAAPTTEQVLNATAGLTAGGVGTYGFFGYRVAANTTLGLGATTAGSNLAAAGYLVGDLSLWPTTTPNAFYNVGISGGASPSGTWRSVGQNGRYAVSGGSAVASLWIRIS